MTYSAAFAVTGDGARLLEYRATDNAGNVEATKSLGLQRGRECAVDGRVAYAGG